MQVYQSFAEVDPPRAAVCTVGTFDGVHLGHQQLLRALVDDAHTRGVPSVVITFFPHPRVVLGRTPVLYLTLPDEKAHQLELLGVDILVVLAFNMQTIQTSATEFVQHMIERLRMVSLWIGADFALGKGRQGDASYLRTMGAEYGFAVNVLSAVSAGVEQVSSTRIRTALSRGDLREVRLCLGRPYELIGKLVDEYTVRPLDQRALPAVGVYAATVCGEPARVAVQDTPGGRMLKLQHPISFETLAHNQIVITFD
jgi:riboflavin kinase / FMN adenylyltransferase